jgi:hypothetical protein
MHGFALSVVTGLASQRHNCVDCKRLLRAFGNTHISCLPFLFNATVPLIIAVSKQ